VLESISPMVYYSRVVSRTTPHPLSVSLFFESDAVSAIGLVCLASSGCDIDLMVFRRIELLNGPRGYQISEGDLNYLNKHIFYIGYDIQVFILILLLV